MSQTMGTTKVDTVAFALALYRRVATGDAPVLLSPVSVSLALGPLHVGARGDTAAGILCAMAGGELESRDRAVPDRFLEADGKTLCLAIGLWLDRGFKVDPAFVEAVNAEPRIQWFDVAFADAEASRGKINLWTEEKTNRRIRHLIRPGMLSAQTQFVATSAVHFRDEWSSPFPAGDTSPAPFARADGTSARVPMMRDLRRARFARNKDASLLELDYRHGCSLYVFLPDSSSGLERLEGRLTPAMLDRWVDSLQHRWVDIQLPRFRQESACERSGLLSELGMKDAFDPARADFSGIGRSAPGQPLFLSGLIHRTFIDVNERETEAAAASATWLITGIGSTPRCEKFHADHPFLYMIRNGPRGSIVFIGRTTGR